MPVILVDKLPLPNLKVYTAGSVLLLSVAVYYALSVTSDPNWRVNATLHRQEVMAAVADDGEPPKIVQPFTVPTTEMPVNGTRNLTEQFVEVMTFMMQEPLCMWTLINIAYCTLVVFGFVVQRVVFGRLRVSEAQRVKDKFWNYVFYKFIFVFGVINVQYMDEVLLWCSWFTLVGFLHLLGQLCKDRFEYLSSSPNTPRWAHARLACLLGGILAACAALLAVAAAWGLPAGRDTFAFMAAECVLVLVSALHVVARYALQLREADAAGPLAYYTHLVFDSTSLVVELMHVVHMVVWSNMLVSMASLVLLMQLRHLLHELQARVRRHRLYTTLATHMSRNYPMASKEEVEKNQDNCAICWEPMKEARKLPCSHLFHNSCLCRWVQQDASCPTCRRALAAREPRRPHHPHPPHVPLAPLAPLVPRVPRDPDTDAALPRPQRHPNHLFHFDGSRYVSWLPSFSVEVTRVRVEPPAASQIEAMARQVQQMFPHYPLSTLAADLVATRSATLTVDNILEGRLPPPSPPSPPSPPPPPAASPASPTPAPTPAPTAETTPTTQESERVTMAAVRRRGPDTSEAAASVSLTSTPQLSVADTAALYDSENRSNVGHVSTRFSKISSERETMLQRRKELLIANARRKYLEKMAAKPSSAEGQPPAAATAAGHHPTQQS